MISSAFKSAAQNEAAQQTQFAGNVSSGIKDVATTVAAIAGLTLPTGNLFGEVAKANFANKVGGIGGNIMLASLQERKQAIKAAAEQQDILKQGIEYTRDLVSDTLKSNAINNFALKSLDLVFNKLVGARQSGAIDKKGNFDIQGLGKVNVNSPLGQKLLEAGDWENDNDRKGS